jgi:hypothetical protein
MPTQHRRFGAFHRYQLSSQPRTSSPAEVDPLLLAALSDNSEEIRAAAGDNSEVKVPAAVRGDKSEEMAVKWCDGSRKISTISVEKPVENAPFGVTSF